MKLLIDCVTNKFNLLLIDSKNKVLDYLNLNLNNNLNEMLVESVKNILNKNKTKKESIKELFIINGPGSFTSLRIISVFVNSWKIIFNIKIFQIDFGKWNSICDNEIIWWNDKQKNVFYYMNDGSNNFTKKINQEEFEKIINDEKKMKIKKLEDNDIFFQWKTNNNKFNIVNKFIPYYIGN